MIVSDANEAPGFQLDVGLKFQGSKSSMRLLGWPAAMASRVALSQAYAVQLGVLDERRDARPCGRAFIMPGEQRVFAIQGNRPGEILDGIAIHLDAPVVEEELEAVPVAGSIGELPAEAGLGRDAGAPLLQPVAEGLDQGRAARLPFGETSLGAGYRGSRPRWHRVRRYGGVHTHDRRHGGSRTGGSPGSDGRALRDPRDRARTADARRRRGGEHDLHRVADLASLGTGDGNALGLRRTPPACRDLRLRTADNHYHPGQARTHIWPCVGKALGKFLPSRIVTAEPHRAASSNRLAS